MRSWAIVDSNRLGIIGFFRGGLLTQQAAISLGDAVQLDIEWRQAYIRTRDD